MNKIAPNLNKGQVPASQAFPFEKEILEWNLEESIQRIKPKVETFRRCAADLAKELYIAHEVLAVRGGDRKTEDAPVFTWSDFCEAVGISRKTAGKYMSLYDPAQDKVLDPEELAERKNLLIAPDSAHEARVAHAMATGERPEGWTDEDEREYRKRRQNERFAELAKKWGDRNFHLSQASGRDYFAEAMKTPRTMRGSTLRTGIRPPHSIQSLTILRHISRRLQTLPLALRLPTTSVSRFVESSMRWHCRWKSLASLEMPVKHDGYSISGYTG